MKELIFEVSEDLEGGYVALRQETRRWKVAGGSSRRD